MEEAIAAADLVVSLIPYIYHAAVIKAAIKGRTHVVTTSYVSPAMRELDAAARQAGIVILNEIGLDPGIDHLYAVKTIGEVHEKGGKVTLIVFLFKLHIFKKLFLVQVKHFISYCGGLPAPEASDNPLGYKFSWSSRGVLLALLNTAKYYINGQPYVVPGSELMSTAKPYFITPAYAFVAYPNRDSTPFREYYNIPEAQTVLRGTLRYQGFPEFISVLVKIGFLSEDRKDWLKEGLSWAQITQKAIGANDSSES